MSRLEDKRTWLGGGAVAAVLIAAASWFGVISPQLSSTSALRSDADSAETQNVVLAAKLTKLKRQNDEVGQLRASLRTALGALPFESGLPAFTRQVSAQATQHKVALTSMAVGSIAPAVVSGATPTAATPTTTSGTTTTAVAPLAIPITLTSTGSAKNQLAFLQAVQVTGPRRALVTSTSLSSAAGATAGSTDKASTMTIQLSVFSTPLSAAARAQLEKLLSGK